MGVFDIFKSDKGEVAATRANDARVSGLRTGFDKALGYYDEGLAGATTQYERAAEPFGQFIESGVAGNQAYGDAIGLSGQEGYDRATEAFRAQPGYEFALESGLDAVDRRAASRGMLGSGNTNLDTIRFSQGLADQEYQKHLDNLYRSAQGGQTAAQGQASVLTNLASTINETGVRKGGLAYDTETGVGKSQAQLEADKYAAQQSASKNIWDAVFNVAKLGASIVGGGGNITPASSGAINQNSSIATR